MNLGLQDTSLGELLTAQCLERVAVGGACRCAEGNLLRRFARLPQVLTIHVVRRNDGRNIAVSFMNEMVISNARGHHVYHLRAVVDRLPNHYRVSWYDPEMNGWFTKDNNVLQVTN